MYSKPVGVGNVLVILGILYKLPESVKPKKAVYKLSTEKLFW